MTELDGYLLHGFFKSGAHRVSLARSRIDGINVFPVPDGDTGSNMAATLLNAIDAIEPGPSAADTLSALADAALDSARGNSGVILAQFIYGLSEAVVNARVRTREFAAAAGNAYARAKASISQPKDGTILSVINDWSASLLRKSQGIDSFDELMHATASDLAQSLESTRDVLPEMRTAGVVDAGAAGFVEFIAGARDYLAAGAPAFQAEPGQTSPAASVHHDHDGA
ncbi:MAG TPA: DAK2 domain-containing protein, partial [Spirochaetales bacterium]|nr:DAK2 domain-containing protein [Spirochaetales bacterium]